MIVKTVIDILYVINETRKAIQLIALSPLGIAAGGLLALSTGSAEL